MNLKALKKKLAALPEPDTEEVEFLVVRKNGELICSDLNKETASLVGQIFDVSKIRRDRLLSYFSWLIGGWNASPPNHAGRLRGEPNYDDDEKIARLLLERHESDVTYPLKEELKTLKARLYDLEHQK